MVAPFVCDEKVTIERKTGATDPDYGTDIDAWEVVADRIWANVEDVLPRIAETTNNGLRIAAQRARLRVRNNSAVTAAMRVTLHSRGDKIMQIIIGPALLNDRVHMECMLESYSS